MRDEREPPDLNTPAVPALGWRASAVRAARWLRFRHVRQVVVNERAVRDMRRLCTGLSTDFLDNGSDTEARGEPRAMHCADGGYL